MNALARWVESNPHFSGAAIAVTSLVAGGLLWLPVWFEYISPVSFGGLYYQQFATGFVHAFGLMFGPAAGLVFGVYLTTRLGLGTLEGDSA